MASVSSLLKSAETTQKKVRQQQDAEVAYEWSQSAKTYDDFTAYSNYVNNQAGKTADPTEQLGYQKVITTARSGYVSNEIQRQTIDVIEGRATNTQKYSQMVGLYYQAMDSGNNDLVQSLNLQLDNLSLKIQAEAEAAQNAAATMAMNGVKSLSALVDKMKNGTEGLQLPDGTLIKPLAVLNDELATGGDTKAAGYFQEMLHTVTAMQSTIADAYQGATTQDAVDSIESKFGDVLTGTQTFKTAAGNLDMQNIELAYRSALANNPIYSITTTRNDDTGATEYKLQKNKIDNFIWVRNDDGTYQAVNEATKKTSQYQSLDTQVTDNGFIVGTELKPGDQGYDKSKKIGQIAGGTGTIERNNNLSIKNRLANLGYDATQNSDGTITLVDPSGRQYTATISPDGSVRYFGDTGQLSGGQAGLYEINIFNGNVNEVNPQDASIFGEQSQFGGLISKASDEGVRIINSLAGVAKPVTDLLSPRARIDSISGDGVPYRNPDFSGGTPIFGSALQGTNGLLQSAQQIRDQKMQAFDIQAQQQAAQQLQPATAFNLNQTPVGNGVNRSIQIARPVAQPAITVAPVAPTPKVNVAQAPAQPTLGVAKPQAQPTLKVQ